MRIKEKTFYLILGILNVLVILISAFLIWNSKQNEMGASFFYHDEDEKSLKDEYSTSEMKKGIYDVSVKYTADGDSYILSCNAKADGGRYPILYADEHQLWQSKNEMSFRLWLNSDIDYLVVTITSKKPAPEISIDSIMLKRNFRLTFTYQMLQICGMLLLLDVVAAAMQKRKVLMRWVEENLYVFLGLLGILCITSFDIFSVSQLCGHDIFFHYTRIAGVAEGLATGEFPVKIQPGWCNGYGYASSVFYGDVLLYFPAILYILGVPLMYTYKVYLFLIHIGTVGIAYYCYQKLSGDRYIGLVCTALSVLSVNRILNVYTRAAVGEYSAYMFFPLVLLGITEILCQKEEMFSQKKTNGWLFLTIGMTGILQTHILSFELTCIVLGITVLLTVRRLIREKGRLGELIKSTVFALCLNAGFLVSFLDFSKQELEIFKEQYEYGIQGLGLSLYELFSLPTQGTGSAMLGEAGLKGRFPASLGLGVIAVIVLLAITLIKCKWEKQEKNTLLVVFGLAGLCIWMSTYYFPWNKLAIVPGIRNVVFSIQFPWRVLSLGIPLITYVACLVLVKIKGCIAWSRMKYLLLGLCLLIGIQGVYSIDLAMRGKHVVLYDASESLRSDNSLMGAEYLFKDTKRKETRSDQEVSGQNVMVENVEREGNRITAVCSAISDAYLEFPMFAYDHYRCIDTQTGTEFPITKGKNYKIRVDLPADYQGTLTVFFKEPWNWRAAEVLSMLTWIALAGYLCIRRRQKRKMAV